MRDSMRWLGLLLRLVATAHAFCQLAPIAALSEPARQLRIGVQYGLGYLPLYVARERGLFADAMREHGLEPVPVELVPFAGGPQINDGLLSGNLELGSGGLTAMMVFCDRTRSAGDSRFFGVTALASVPYELFTVDPDLRSLKDLNRDRDRIGLPSIKVSVPAIYLQMAAEALYGRGKHEALDAYTVSLAQPDGVISLLSGGGTVNSYLFSPPFSDQVAGKPGVHAVWSSNELFGSPATALATWTTVKFRRENPKLTAALVAGVRNAAAFVAASPKEAAAIYLNAEKSKLAPGLVAGVIADRSRLRFSLAPEQSERIADFLSRTGSIKTRPASWKDFFFPEIHGEEGS
jgi:NitT/TauT family transport system substrate-binding protein